LIFALVIVLSLIGLYFLSRQFFPSISPVLVLSIQLLGLLASLPSFGVRMQEFSFLFLLLEFWIINRFYYHGKTASLFLLIPLFYLWACIHGSFLFGLGLLVAFVVFNILLVKKQKKTLGILILVIVLTIAGTFLTPYQGNLYSFLSGYKQTFYLTAIQEWLPFYYFPIKYLQLIYLGILTGAWVLYLYNFKIKKSLKNLDFWQLFLFILFLFLALKSRRNFPLAFVATAPFFTKIISELLEISKIKLGFWSKYLRCLLVICLSLSIITIGLDIRIKHDPFSSYCHKYPCQAVNFLQANSQYQNKNLFNEYGWGGYLLWTRPERKIFIDGRLPQVIYNEKTFLEEYLLAFAEETDRVEYFAKHQVDLVFLRTKDEALNIKNWEKIIFRLKPEDLIRVNHLRNYLETSPLWQIIYQDQVATIYYQNRD